MSMLQRGGLRGKGIVCATNLDDCCSVQVMRKSIWELETRDGGSRLLDHAHQRRDSRRYSCHLLV